MKTLIRRDDKVAVITGKEKGKTGKVLRLYPQSNRVLVSGLNFVKRSMRPTRDMQQGGFIERESPISISNIMLYCNKCNRGVRVGIKRLPDNTRMRYCKRCELEI